MSTTLEAAVREKVGTRHARALRAAGRIPASLQETAEKPHLDLSIDEEAFLTTRRHHQHLYELSIGGQVETALVKELAWDVFGERILHVEFRRVDRHAKTDVPVPIEFFGTPKSGLLVHVLTELTVRTTPDNIPDTVVVKVGELEPGALVTAGMVELPEGVELGEDVEPDTEVARVAAPRAEAAAPAEGEAEEGGEAGEGDEAATAGEGKGRDED
jgi:large subunit ribosomal protein L25